MIRAGRFRSVLLLLFLAATLPGQLLAWGPHPEITQAAVESLPPGSAFLRQLGPEANRLREYCWMADWRRQLRREASGWFYTDDYLLFPRTTVHRDHLCPEVKQTYAPYFRRALQALRTETPRNAARWIGSIIHFTEDTASPPHAAEIRGDVHSKMENWVDAKAIHLAGYQPRVLGETDEAAVQGFLARMDGLIAFSKERAERARPFVVSGDRAATEPIVLESALEASRVVADLLLTLGHLAALPNQAPSAELKGQVAGAAPSALPQLSTKVMLVGTDYSTLANTEGRYEFRNLPPGSYEVVALRPGSSTPPVPAQLTDRGVSICDLQLVADAAPGSLLRNGVLTAVWVAAGQPDMWYRIKSRADGVYWEGEMIPLEKGTSYHLKVAWQEKATGQVVVRLRKSADFSQLPMDLPPLAPGATEREIPAEGGFAQVLIFTDDAPSKTVKHVALVPAETPPGASPAAPRP